MFGSVEDNPSLGLIQSGLKLSIAGIIIELLPMIQMKGKAKIAAVVMVITNEEFPLDVYDKL